ncbi:L-serine ammonia-lyase [Aliagarivorans marinus]|uniref:L-serine ammonia-lyase n=1 Tax=Aliagarivorans marinus TaxID=561965 RepID=UPI00040B6727|nr:L-serine ammonia-lyase [Aliagarivorans marinus]
MVSVFDLFTIGIGPSSSHTVGPMRAAKRFVDELATTHGLESVEQISVELFGSLGATGKGHGTGKAVILGLMGELPESIDVAAIPKHLAVLEQSEQLMLAGTHAVPFPREGAILFHRNKSLPQHSNALTFHAQLNSGSAISTSYYSIGGGYILEEGEGPASKTQTLPHPFSTADELLALASREGKSIANLMLDNELTMHSAQEIDHYLEQLWATMQACVSGGMNHEGMLPGGLKLVRRASAIHRQLNAQRSTSSDPLNVMDWVNLYALAVSEENAAGGRVVTAPTNGAAGIIPAVLHYYDHFVCKLDPSAIRQFFLTTTAIGALYKLNASISGAEVGCQGEVGVACSMAAAGLTALFGGSAAQIENAAEIGIEHNLGLTCDPIGGLVQVPCIERNAMGAMKAINAARLALRGSGQHKVSLDKAIKTMWETGCDMQTKYKETARGGLAVNIIEC